MRLTVTTPLAVVADVEDVVHLRAEDETGAFGILTGHADFVTALAISVVSWRDRQGREHYVAVHGGMLEVRDAKLVAIITREAVLGDDLRWLEQEVLVRFRRQLAEEETARKDAQRLYLAAIRQISRYLRSGRSQARPGEGHATLAEGFEE